MVANRTTCADWWHDGDVQLCSDWYTAGYERDIRFNMPWCCEYCNSYINNMHLVC